jgi:hypothetical protein
MACSGPRGFYVNQLLQIPLPQFLPSLSILSDQGFAAFQFDSRRDEKLPAIRILFKVFHDQVEFSCEFEESFSFSALIQGTQPVAAQIRIQALVRLLRWLTKQVGKNFKTYSFGEFTFDNPLMVRETETSQPRGRDESVIPLELTLISHCG